MASWFNEIVNTAAGTVVGAANQLTSFLNPGMARLRAAGLNPGGGRLPGAGLDRANVNYSNSITKDISKDWRVRVSTNSEALSYSGVMSPLGLTQGVIFPYTPQITVTHKQIILRKSLHTVTILRILTRTVKFKVFKYLQTSLCKITMKLPTY